MNNKTGMKGFTLLEVLVALAIISGLLITLIYTVNYQLGIVERQETVTVATLLAKSTLTELEKKPESKKGKFEAPYETYSYETAVKDSPYPGVKEITVIVTAGKEEVKLNQYAYR
jgi:general secretion pathway protein I